MSFELTTIGQYASVQGGYAFKSQDFSTSGFRPVLKIKNVRHGYIDYGDVAYVSEDIAKACQRWETASGDILISMTGSGPNAPESLVGRVARVWGSEPKSLINQRVGRLVLKGDLAIDKDFLFYVLSQRETQEYLVSNSTGSANQVNINAKTIESVSCPNVSFEESRKIASILKCLDQRIRLLRETNATLEAIAQALFKSWFVDFDPVHANAGTQAPSLPAEMQALFPSRLVESPQGLIPEGWMVGCIGDVVSVKGGYAFKSADFQDSGLPVIKIKNIVGDGTVDVSDVQKVSETIASKAQRFALQSGDILMAMTGATIGKVGVFVSENEELAYLNQRVAKFENKSLDQKNTWLAFIAFSNAFMAEQIVNAASGSAQPNISAAGIESTRLVVPSDKLVLSSFNDLVEPLFTGWINNQKTIRTLANLRDTLLPRLISGQLRLPEAEAALVKVK